MQEYWSGLPFPSPGDLLDPGIEPGSPALQADYHLSHQGSQIMIKSTQTLHNHYKKKIAAFIANFYICVYIQSNEYILLQYFYI